MVRPFTLGQVLFKENQRTIMSLYESIYKSAHKKANLKNEKLLHFLYHIEKTLGIPDVHIAPLNIPNLLSKKFSSSLPHGDIVNYVIYIYKPVKYYPHENEVHSRSYQLGLLCRYSLFRLSSYRLHKYGTKKLS
jgi:hypothetical protein